jgi:hypothetical protein
MTRRILISVLCGWPALASADALTIEHKEVGCVAAGKFPRFEARFDPANAVARARLHFKPEGWPHWYSVPMKQEGASFLGVLPKLDKKLEKFAYYISVVDRSFTESRTPEYAPGVVSGPAGCQQNKVLALGLRKAVQVIVSGPEGVLNAPLVPVGFSTDGVIAGVAGSGSAPTAAGASGAGATAGAASGTAAAGGAAAAGGGISTALLVVGGVAVAGGATALAVKSGGADENRKVTIEGHVFVTVGGQPGFPGGPPVVGAVVATSLDSRTATTDAAGHFLLETATPCCLRFTPYTITITKAGCQTFSRSHTWGDDARNQTFTLDCP